MTDFFKAILTRLDGVIKVVFILGAVVMFIYQCIQRANQIVDEFLIDMINFTFGAVTTFNFNTAFGGYLPVINSIIPLVEIWSLMVSFFAYWSIVLLLRWVKSFIPGLSN